MANSLQTIAALFVLTGAVASAQSQRPFSHKYHLTQVPSCESCHVDAESSAKADDNLLPFHDQCARCHDETHIKEEPRVLAVQKFNHALHIKMGNVAPVLAAAIKSGSYPGKPEKVQPHLGTKNVCAGCHHGIEESESIGNQAAHFPSMPDCLTCHTKSEPPESCEKCHADNMKFRPDSHTAQFVDNHGTMKLDKPECWSCHGRKFTCKGCH